MDNILIFLLCAAICLVIFFLIKITSDQDDICPSCKKSNAYYGDKLVEVLDSYKRIENRVTKTVYLKNGGKRETIERVKVPYNVVKQRFECVKCGHSDYKTLEIEVDIIR